MKWTVAILAFACCTAFATAKPKAVTSNPNERGVTLIGPAPEYECSANGAHPHETACELFYDCYNDVAHLMACTEDTLFEVEYGSCESAATVDCGDRIRPNGTTGPPPTRTTTTRPPATGTPEPGAPECHPDHHGAYYPDTIYCERYYQCDNYDAILYYCPDDQLFDLVFYGCNFPDKVDCGDRIRPPGPTGTGTNVPPTRPTDTPPEYDCQADGAFPHELYCEKYWDCYNGVATLLSCPGDWLFEPLWSGCERPENVDCGDRMRPSQQPPTTTTVAPPPTTTTVAPPPTTTTVAPPPTTTTVAPPPTTTTVAPPPTTTTGSPGFTCPRPEGYFPDPLDCSAYYVCANNIANHQFCDIILRYSIQLETCDFPENVDCGTRPVPTA